MCKPIKTFEPLSAITLRTQIISFQPMHYKHTQIYKVNQTAVIEICAIALAFEIQSVRHRTKIGKFLIVNAQNAYKMQEIGIRRVRS